MVQTAIPRGGAEHLSVPHNQLRQRNMQATTAEKILTILLRLNALLLCTAFLTVFLPTAWMSSTHAWLGLGEFPDAPITQYLTRSCSLLYAAHGVLLLFIVWRPRKYWALIPVIAVLHMLLGVILLGIDLKAPLPWYWTLAEGPSIFAFGVIVFWLWKKSGDNP